MNGPGDLTPLAASAQQMHEAFTAWVEAGFTRQEALYLLGQVIAAQSSGGTAQS